MDEDEHVAHATAVKLMGSKDYFVQVYCAALQAFIAQMALEKDKNGKLVSFYTSEIAVKYANDAAIRSMTYIDNWKG